MERVPSKQYLGDGVYVIYILGQGYVITAENGLDIYNKIYLEPHVAERFVKYINNIEKGEWK